MLEQYEYGVPGIESAPVEFVRYPLWYELTPNGFEFYESYWVNAGVEAVREDGETPWSVRRWQNHVLPSPKRPPEISLSPIEDEPNFGWLLLKWFTLTCVYQQAAPLPLALDQIKEFSASGRSGSYTLSRRWSPADTIVCSEGMQIKRLKVPLRGEPTVSELQSLLLEKARRLLPPPEGQTTDPGDNPIIDRPPSNLIDVRPYRPLIPERLKLIPSPLLQKVTDTTPTLEKAVAKYIEDLKKPEKGHYRVIPVARSSQDVLPTRAQLRQGIDLFNRTLSQLERGLVDDLSSSPRA